MTDPENDNVDPLRDWWESPLGRCVLKQEKQLFRDKPGHFNGYYQLQVGIEYDLFPEMIVPKFRKRMARSADVEGINESLPFKSNSLDTLILSHVLEFSSDPHQVLREAERILVGDGKMIICCFNPWSWWGLRRLFSSRKGAPWHGTFFGQSRIKDWLSLLNFDVVSTEKLMFRPPLKSEKWLNKTVKLESYGRRFWRAFAGVTILVATKRTIPLTPVTGRWHAGKWFPKKSLVGKPATREKIDGSR